LDAPTRNRAFGYYATILVDIDLSKRAYDEILVEQKGFAFKVEVQYERRPLFCHHCYVIGHNVSTCKWLHPATKVTDHGKKPMAAELLTKKASPRQYRSDKGTSTSGTMQYVDVADPSASATIIDTQERSTTQNIAPPKDVSSSSFSFALQNVSDATPQSVLPQSTIPVLELVTDVVHDDLDPLEVERTQQESWDDSVPNLPVAAAPLLTYVEHVDVHEKFDGATLDLVRKGSSSAVLNIVVHEEVTASSKDIPSTTVLHPHNIVVHTVPTTLFDGSVTPAYVINSVPDPIPAIPSFVANSVLVDNNICTQLLLKDDAVPAAVAIVSSLAPTASSLATHEVGIVHHNNPRIQHDMEIWQRIKYYDKKVVETPFTPVLSKKQKKFLKKQQLTRKPPYRTCSTREPSPSAQ